MTQPLARPDEQDASTNPADILNIAATCGATRSLGPGVRSVVWVQGCAFHCPGCVAPDWIPLQPARLVQPETLVKELLADPRVTGLTFSGGEPMLQASGLAALARLARSRANLNIICFTGFQFEQLVKYPPVPGVSDLLEQVDVLIDGPYIERLNDNRGMRGSRNQRIIHLSGRLAQEDFENYPRRAEIHLRDGQAMLVGVPPLRMKEAFHQAVDQANRAGLEMLRNERV
jgi:anaerobic ribonucleoside-triphosphate reductase activating protein